MPMCFLPSGFAGSDVPGAVDIDLLFGISADFSVRLTLSEVFGLLYIFCRVNARRTLDMN